MEKRYQVNLIVPNSHLISSIEREWVVEMKKNNPSSYIYKTKKGNQKLIQIFNASDIIYNNKLKIKSSIDTTRNFFQNDAQYQLYIFIEQFFDNYFFDRYFKENDIVQFINIIDELLSYIPKKEIQNNILNGYICQYSHYHAFISQLDKKTKSEVYTKFTELEQKITYSTTKLFDKDEKLKSFVDQVAQRVQTIILDKKLDFYSPRTRQEYLIDDQFASPEHRETVVNDDFQKYFRYSTPLISARWIINVIYEKMILMDFTILEKYFMNYCLAKRHKNNKIIV